MPTRPAGNGATTGPGVTVMVLATDGTALRTPPSRAGRCGGPLFVHTTSRRWTATRPPAAGIRAQAVIAISAAQRLTSVLTPEITAKSVLGIQEATPPNSCAVSGGEDEEQQHGCGDRAADVADHGPEPGAEDRADGPREGCGGQQLGDVAGRHQEAVLGARQGGGDGRDDQGLADECQLRPGQQDCAVLPASNSSVCMGGL